MKEIRLMDVVQTSHKIESSQKVQQRGAALCAPEFGGHAGTPEVIWGLSQKTAHPGSFGSPVEASGISMNLQSGP